MIIQSQAGGTAVCRSPRGPPVSSMPAERPAGPSVNQRSVIGLMSASLWRLEYAIYRRRSTASWRPQPHLIALNIPERHLPTTLADARAPRELAGAGQGHI